jgi:hypothetical protein
VLYEVSYVVVKYKFTFIVYIGELYARSLENSCASGGAGFLFFTAPMLGSFVTSAV